MSSTLREDADLAPARNTLREEHKREAHVREKMERALHEQPRNLFALQEAEVACTGFDIDLAPVHENAQEIKHQRRLQTRAQLEKAHGNLSNLLKMVAWSWRARARSSETC